MRRKVDFTRTRSTRRRLRYPSGHRRRKAKDPHPCGRLYRVPRVTESDDKKRLTEEVAAESEESRPPEVRRRRLLRRQVDKPEMAREPIEREELTRFRARLDRRVREETDRARRRAETGLRAEAERFVDERMATQFEGRLAAFSERLDALMAARMADAGRSIAERASSSADQLERRLAASAERATRSIVAEATAAISRSVDEARIQLLDEVEHRTAGLIDSVSDDLDRRVARATSVPEQDRDASELVASLQQTARQAEQNLLDHAARLTAEAERLHRELEDRVRIQSLKRMRSEIERIQMEAERAKRPRRLEPTQSDRPSPDRAQNTRAT
jgi:hypothetical protein